MNKQQEVIEHANVAIRLFDHDEEVRRPNYKQSFLIHQRMLKRVGVTQDHPTLARVNEILEVLN